MQTYFDLKRHFVERTKYDADELIASEVTGKRLNWGKVLANRFSVVVAPANFGKTTEMRKRAEEMRIAGKSAVFIELRKMADRGTMERAIEPPDLAALCAWKSAPTYVLTVFVDSLDEASAGKRESIEYLIGDIADELSWPNEHVQWVISTRPAVLTAEVMDKLSAILVLPTVTATTPALPSTPKTVSVTTTSVVGSPGAPNEKLHMYSMAPLDAKRAERYLIARYPVLPAAQLLDLARDRGLTGFTTSPGGLDVLAHINLVTDPPNSLTEVFHRAVSAVQELQRQDHRVEDSGCPAPASLAEAARKLASASQVCLLPNIEMPQERLGFTDGVLSARAIAGSILTEKSLTQLLNSQLFIDVGYHQVKLYPDELTPFLGAQRLASLVQSPEQAHKLVELFTWRAPTGEQGVYRQFLPLLGWLATLSSHCREEVLEREPQAVAFFGDLRNSDIPLAAAKQAIRETISRLVVLGDRLGRGMFNLTSENFWQAGDKRIEPLLVELFKEHGKHHLARTALLDIVSSSRSGVLRTAVLREHGGSYARLIDRTGDLRYILDLGLPRDLDSIATALKTHATASESLVATLVSRLSWSYLTPKDIADLVDTQFARGRGGFHIGYALGAGIFDVASNQQLYMLTRSLVIRLARLRDGKGHAVRTRGRSDDRYVEVVSEALAELVGRPSFVEHSRVALLCLVMQRVLSDGHVGSADILNLRQALIDNESVRRIVLSLRVKRAGHDHHNLWTVVYGYDSLFSLQTGDVETIDSPYLAAVVKEHEKNQAAHQAKPKVLPRSKDDRHKVGAAAKKQLNAMLPQLTDGSATNGLAWVAEWLLHTNPSSRYGEVKFEVFEREAGPHIALAVLNGLKQVWRRRAPSFKESEPRTTFLITAAGLQGLHLELSHGDNLPLLTDDEIRSALRYAPFEINGYPRWFWPLVKAHEKIAGQELVQMVKQASVGAVSLEHAEELLTSMEDAPVAVQELLASLAWGFIKQRPNLRDYAVKNILTVATVVPGVVAQSDFEVVALAKMKGAFDGPMPEGTEGSQAVQAAQGQSVIWAANWLTGYPKTFCKAVESWLKKAPSDARAFIFAFVAHLGMDNGARLVRIGQASDEGVPALASLYGWTMAAVKPEDDVEHPDGMVYTLGAREHAEQLRSALIPAIAAARSQRAYEVLDQLRLAASGRMATYLQNVQFEMSEAQLTRPTLSQQKYNEFERDFTQDVSNTTSFAMTVHSDLSSVKYDIENGDYSLRRFFSEVVLKRRKDKAEEEKEGLALEADFQRLLASELHHYSKGRYSVTVEPHTAESKRRDVLCSKGDMFVSIELKMSMRWTIDKYIEALEKQLVGQYMRHRKATIGFLVIVLQEKNRFWKDPDTGGRVDFDGLLKILSKKALALEAKNRKLYLRVLGVDATAPENFRKAGKALPKKAAMPAARKRPAAKRASALAGSAKKSVVPAKKARIPKKRAPAAATSMSARKGST